MYILSSRLPLSTLDEAGELTETIDLWPVCVCSVFVHLAVCLRKL